MIFLCFKKSLFTANSVHSLIVDNSTLGKPYLYISKRCGRSLIISATIKNTFLHSLQAADRRMMFFFIIIATVMKVLET